jgi:hypothetical protein
MTPTDALAAAAAEPEPPAAEPEPPAAEPDLPAAALAPVALMQVLPVDFPLPALIRFVPDVKLKAAAEQAAAYALSLDVRGEEGLHAADDALRVLLGSQKGITEHFEEPKEIANRLHNSLTSTLADWLAPGKAAIKAVGRKVYVETQRLKAIAHEERRKAQAEAD